jgi:hypothetical protein
MQDLLAQIDWTAFWSGLLGTTIPGLLVSLLVLRVTRTLNQSLEKFKSDLQRDVVKFSRWHEKRVEASVAIYSAFREYLDFLRLAFYWEHKKGMDLTPMHTFRDAIEENIVYLDDTLAEKVLQYQGELLVFWNESIRQIGSDAVRNRLDFEIPAYLRRLRADINESMDPTYQRSKGAFAPILHPPPDPPKPYPV